MRLFAISKLFREHKTYFEFANNTSRIEELVNNKKLFYNPLESHIKERGKYHGFSKLLDPEYGVTDNEAVNNGLAFLKSFHDTKLKIKEKIKSEKYLLILKCLIVCYGEVSTVNIV